MPDWLLNDLTKPADVAWNVVALRLLISVVGGLAVAGTCYASRRRAPVSVVPLATTLVLLTILVAMTALVIGVSVAKAFTLVGALSIVRFRTVVDDTRDTAFVIYAVVVGMGIGSGQFGVCLIGIPIVSLVALALATNGSKPVTEASEHRLEIRMSSGHDPVALLTELFERELASYRLIQIVTARQGLSLDLRYNVRLKKPADPLALVTLLQQVEGVQTVEVREA
ncbi:MAG: DUF4956 domain-containing protein [Planctomycetota bacterium]